MFEIFIFTDFGGIFRVFFHKQVPKLCVFHDFLSHHTSQLPENLNLSTRSTNVKYNEDRFSFS